MSASEHIERPQPGELARLAESFVAEAASEERLAASLRRLGGMPLAVEANELRARKHRRTAEVLYAYAHELDLRGSRPTGDMMAAE